jgi:hypothetical protein
MNLKKEGAGFPQRPKLFLAQKKLVSPAREPGITIQVIMSVYRKYLLIV